MPSLLYYPFLRAKKHELLAMLAVPAASYNKMLPVLEPVSVSVQALSSYRKLAAAHIPFILITNPSHGDTTAGDVQRILIARELASHTRLTLGFVVDNGFTMAALQAFLSNNATHKKAVIFQFSPRPSDITAIVGLLQSHPEVEHILFEDTKLPLSASFAWHPQRAVIHDGFQRAKKNADYGSDSAFPTYKDAVTSLGLQGFGDYMIVGDVFTESGGAGYVVALHVTAPDGNDLNVHHFLSVSDSSIPGLSSPKFKEAVAALATSGVVAGLRRTTGLTDFLNWHANSHYPGLGAAKQAAMQHHLELVCSII